VFQVGRQLLPSRTAPVVDAVALQGEPVRIKRVQLPGDADSEEAGAATEMPAGEGRAASAAVDVATLNRCETVPRGAGEPVCCSLVPRADPVFKEDRGAPGVWELDRSLFAPYEELLVRRAFCDKSFEADWKLCRGASLVKGDGECALVRKQLRDNYAEIHLLYASLCSAEWSVAIQAPAQRRAKHQPLQFGVGLHEYTHFIVQHGLVGEDLCLAEADAYFLASAAPNRDTAACDRTEGRLLQRHSFLELLVRLATRWASRAATGAGKPSASKALAFLLGQKLAYPSVPMKCNYRAVEWREEVLHTQEVEHVLRRHCQDTLDPLFAAFSQPADDAHQQRYVDSEGWFAFLDALEVLPYNNGQDHITLWDRVWLWRMSAMARADEVSISHQRLSFAEFLEAIARLVALLLSRERVANGRPEEAERWEYGLGAPSATTVFGADKEGVMDCVAFARHLAAFLTSAPVRRAAGSERAAAR